jgi:glycine betaine catabolism B
MRVTLVRIETVTSEVKTFWFKPQRPARYIAGQFIELMLPGSEHDERGPRRWFTLSSAPTEPLLGITTKFSANGSSFKRELASLPIGTTASFAEPMGDFVLPKDTTIPLIFVANGIGVTPIRSMTQYLVDSGQARDITMLYAGRSQTDMPFADLFARCYGGAYHSLEGQRLTAQAIVEIAAHKPESLIYLAGSEHIVEVLGRELEKSGVAKHRIVIDFFSGYTADI